MRMIISATRAGSHPEEIKTRRVAATPRKGPGDAVILAKIIG
jgi:hypothetical protein